MTIEMEVYALVMLLSSSIISIMLVACRAIGFWGSMHLPHVIFRH